MSLKFARLFGILILVLSAHLAPALIAKSIRPSINLPLAMGLCILPDIVHAVLSAAGVEALRKEERYSHSFVAVFMLAAGAFLLAGRLGMPSADSLIYSACIISHFAFDLINRRQMPLTPWGPYLPGIGLHERGFLRGYWLSFAIELALVIISVSIYAWHLFDGTFVSLIIPLLLLSGMLVAELWYFRIYEEAIAKGLEMLKERIIES